MIKPLINTKGFNSVVKGKNGYILYNKNDIYIGKAIEKYGEFSEAETIIFKQLCRKGDIVVEVGANIGTHTLVLSQLIAETGRIYAFEPQRIIFQALCANMALNSVINAECFQLAVSSYEGYIKIPDIRYDRRGNFGGIEIDKFNRGIKTKVVKLDKFIDPPRMKLLKIDVEGMEAGVIKGAIGLIKKLKPVLYVENDRIDKSTKLIELIKSLDYRLFWHLPPLFNPENFANCKENIYPGIVSVNMLCFHNSIDLKIDGFNEIIDPDDHPMKQKG